MKTYILFTLALLISFSSFGQTAEEYFNSGYDKDDLKDYSGAIADYTKAIELDPNFAYAYYNRGNSKKNLKDYSGAIADYTKAIELNPNYAYAYVNRGISKEDLGDLNGACADWKKAAKLGSVDAADWVAIGCN
ncbi:MAG: tetratricopeptide repeat protein [Bacteroidetes bacterium]|nr:tetratricopeptide repeat protein [Bacteroidota bacterium]